MGSFYMESTQINYRRDETVKTVDQKLQELSETSAIDTDIAPVFKSTNTYAPGDMVYYRNKLYTFNVEHSGAWAAGDVTATDVTTEISSLRSGLTNVDVALSLPENCGKNVLPLTLDRLKDLNSSGSWNNNVYTYKSLTCTVETNNEGYITSIKVNGTADSQAVLVLFNGDIGTGSYTLNGITGGSASTYLFYAPSAFGEVYSEKTANVSGSFELDLYVRSGVTLENQMFYPMIRPATITDPTFAPYIPSVDARLDAVGSGLTNLHNGYYRVNVTGAGEDKWYKIAEHTATTWNINVSIIAIPSGAIKRLTLRYDQSTATFNNDITKIESVFGAVGKLAYKYSANKAEVFWKAQRYGINTYTVLSESGNTAVAFQTPVLTEYVDSDMDYIESST